MAGTVEKSRLILILSAEALAEHPYSAVYTSERSMLLRLACPLHEGTTSANTIEPGPPPEARARRGKMERRANIDFYFYTITVTCVKTLSISTLGVTLMTRSD